MPIQAAFTLTPNEIYNSLGNMIISQEVYADNLGKHQTLVDKARVDGTLFGDRKLFYSTDVLESVPWAYDPIAGATNRVGVAAEALNLLNTEYAKDPEVQAIVLDKFRQIRLTLDNYLSKRAWSSEGAFSQFASIMLGWMRDTKRVYDGTLYNVFIGTDETSVGDQQQSIDVTTAVGSATGMEANVLEATEIARGLADLLVEMGDYSREFNDYGHLRSYSDESITVIWNSDFVNKIKKVDLPTIFHKEGLVDKFEQEVLPARYFGTVYASSGTAIAGDRSMIETTVTVSGVDTHVFPGDLLPVGASYGAGEAYANDADIICKVVAGKLPPYMSAFEVGTSFFNPRALCENHYLTFAHNSLEHLKNYPFITVRKV